MLCKDMRNLVAPVSKLAFSSNNTQRFKIQQTIPLTRRSTLQLHQCSDESLLDKV